MKNIALIILLGFVGWTELRSQCQCDFHVEIVQDPIDSCCFDVLFCHNQILPSCSLPAQYGPLTIYTNGNPFATGDISSVTSSAPSIVTATMQTVNQAVFTSNFVSLGLNCSPKFNLGRICLSSAPSGFVNFSAVIGQPGNPCDIPLITSQFMVPPCTNPALFEKVYGDANDNRPTAVKAFGDGVYVAGYRVVGGMDYGTFSKFDLNNGSLVWERQLSTDSRILDFEYDAANDQFLLVGHTATLNPTMNNRSIFLKMDDSGNHVFSKYYDQPGREAFTRIVNHPTAADPNFPYYILGRKNPPNAAPSSSDIVFMYNMNAAGVVQPGWPVEYDCPSCLNTPTDDEYHLGLIALSAGNLMMTGTVTNNDGMIVEVDGITGSATGYRFTGQPLDIYDGISLGNDRVVIVGENWANHHAFVAVLQKAPVNGGPIGYITPFGNTPIIELPDITNFKDIWIDKYGKLYVIGESNLSSSTKPYQVVHKINYSTHAGSADLTVDWAKYLEDIGYAESDYSNGNISVTPAHDRIFYADARLKSQSFFGSWDMLVGAYDLDLNSACQSIFPFSTPTLQLTGFQTTINSAPATIPQSISDQCQPLDYCCTTFCASAPCTASLSYTLGSCFNVNFTAASSSCFIDPNTYDWDFDGDGVTDATTTTPNTNHFFCGGGVFNVCVTVTDHIGCAAVACQTVTVNNCNGCATATGTIDCTEDSDTYLLNLFVTNQTNLSNCTYLLANNPSINFISGPNYTPSATGVTITGFFTLTGPLPNFLNFTVNLSCVCPSGQPFNCQVSANVPMVCCKQILVPDREVCEDNSVLNVPINPSWGTPYNITQVTWYVQPKPSSGICPIVPWQPVTPYQDNLTNVLEPLHLYPQNMAGDVCVYAVVHLNDGPCTVLTTNVACIRLCEPTNCSLNNLAYCYTGTCITPPDPLSLTLTPTTGNCQPTWEWFAPGNLNTPVQVGGMSYQPTQCLSMANWMTDCYEDFIYTVVITDDCGQRTCEAVVRLDSDEAPKGKLEMDPLEQPQPFCPKEDVTLKFTPGCAGDPAMWKWFKRDCVPTGTTPTVTPLTGAGLMNGIYNTNQADNSYYYYVETKNGVCPADTVQLKVEIKEPLNITQFDAISDPCAVQQVDLSITIDQCRIQGCLTPCTSTYTVDWYKDGFYIGTTNTNNTTVPSATFTYTIAPLAGNYYAIVKDDNCLNNTKKSWVSQVFPCCVPVIKGPWSMCDNDPVMLEVEMVLPPNKPCPNSCSFSWTGPGIIGPNNTAIITVNLPGIYTVTSSCFTNGSICVKSKQFILNQCQSILCPPQFCCADFDVFSARIETDVAISVDNSTCTATFSMEDLPGCDFIESIDWGDGNQSTGPFSAGDTPAHTYGNSGDYTISFTAVEQNETTGANCFTKTFSQVVSPICNMNCCGPAPYSNLSFGPIQGGGTISVSCGTDVILPCQPGTNYVLSGSFTCACAVTPQMTWELWAPGIGMVDQGTVSPNPNFSIPLPSGYFYVPGTYQLVLTGSCGQICPPCIIYFVVNPPCPPLCPCDVNQFNSDVAKGFWLFQKVLTPCNVCVKPKALTPCDMVSWEISGTGIPVGSPITYSTVGKQTLCHNFAQSGTYKIKMIVTRKKGVNSICEVFSFEKTITLNCTPIIVLNCENPRAYNPDFGDEASEGVLGDGGVSAFWNTVTGTPTIDSVIGTSDNWVTTLSGNADNRDAIRTVEGICLEKDSGTINIRLRSVNALGAASLPKQGETLVVRFVRGDNFQTLECIEPDCYEIAAVELPDSLDEWADIELLYNISAATVEDSCATASLMVRPVVYATNSHSTGAGTDSISNIQLDYFCLRGPGFVGTTNKYNEDNIRIYPNPTSGDLTLEFRGTTPKAGAVQILDLLGRTLRTETLLPGRQQHQLRFAGLPAGVYFVKITDEGTPIFMEKIINQ